MMAREDGAIWADAPARVVIVGAGHAGGTAAALLRQAGHAGPVTLIGAEDVPPYQRPPLSKAFLKGEAAFDALKLKPDTFHEQQRIGLRLGTRVAGIDRAARQVVLEGGGAEPYDALILATGSRNRRLDCVPDGMGGVHELRTLADAEGLKGVLRPGARLVIAGGGYIGLEAAASARALGAEAVVVERAGRVLSRTGSAQLARFFEEYHRARGVEVLTGRHTVAAEADASGHVAAVVLDDGRRRDCDALLVGVGAAAEDRLARDCGLDCGDSPGGGVIVDEHARTSDPRIFAAGDMTLRPLPLYEGRMMRLESVPNALEQARAAAAAIAGGPAPKPEAPWFWSDQYDLKLQIAGLALECDAAVTRGDPSAARFAVFHLRGGRLRAVEAVNAPAEFMAGKAWILSGAALDAARLADPAVPLRSAAA